MFAYLSHPNLPIIYSELTDRSMRRMRKVTHRSIVLQQLFYLILGIFGYLSTLDKTTAVILDRRPPTMFTFDWFMCIGRVFMSLTLTLAIPLVMYPCRKSISDMYFRMRGTALKNEYDILHVVVTLMILTFITICGIFVPNILFVFNFLGGFCSPVICLIAPALIYYRMPASYYQRITVLIGSIVCTLFGFTSVALSIINIII
jgi:amino acid permease